MWDNLTCKTTSCNNCNFLTKLFFNSVNNSVKGCCIAVNHTAFHAFNGIFSNDALRCFNTDSAKLRSTGCKGIQGHSHSGKNHASHIMLLLIYHAYRTCSSHINNCQWKRIFMNSCNCICYKICSKLSGIIHQDIQSCFYTWSQYHRFFFQNLFSCKLHGIGNLRYYRGNNAAFNINPLNMI